jgi:protein gp37
LKNSPIEWTDDTWPVVNGCRRVSPGCGGAVGVGGCYAERLVSTRLRHMPKYEGLAVFDERGPHWTGKSRLWVPDLDIPVRTRKPTKFFVANMGDLFFEEVTNDEIAAVFGVMAACPQHTFQVLTKRAKRMREWFAWVEDAARRACQSTDEFVQRATLSKGVPIALHKIKGTIKCYPWPLRNVWLGVSVEDQQRADERIPHLLATPAAVKFVSAEPLLAPVDFSRWCFDRHAAVRHLKNGPAMLNSEQAEDAVGPSLSWVIVGSESGPGARPMAIEWARDIVDQCKGAGVAVFTKQIATPGHAKGGDPAFWPPGDWPRQWPEVRPCS